MSRPTACAAFLAFFLAGTAAADDVSGSRTLLCATLEAHVCVETLGCERFAAADLNIPQFIRVDTKTRKLSTTPASGERRETVVQSLQRADGQLVLQGVEAGRAFSLYILETTGMATFASAAEGRGVTVFGACTPVADD